MEQAGVYLHVPFCKQRCNYCDFYSTVGVAEERGGYLAAMKAALRSQPFGRLAVDSVFFGGGTPTLLGAESLIQLLEELRGAFALSPSAEITLEANPESVTKELLEPLVLGGFNRISFGVQSTNDRELEALGRVHNAQQAREAILLAHEVGFSHISADIMLNIPYQTVESLKKSVGSLTQLPIDHLSAYMLILEEGVPLATSPLLKKLPGEETERELYLETVAQLAKAGFSQYEISNFAKPGGQSRHNLKYWEGADYLGIGPSAHSLIKGRRFSFSPDLESFASSKGSWKMVVEEGTGGGWEEYAMLRLRLVPGLDFAQLEQRYPLVNTTPMKAYARLLVEQNLASFSENRLTFTPQGFLLADYLTGQLLFGS